VNNAGKRAETNTPVMTHLLVNVDDPLTLTVPSRLTIQYLEPLPHIPPVGDF
jgi:hypothetical protein